MTMKAFLFPGQGSQAVGMAADLFPSDPCFCQLVRRASERVGVDLERICRRGPDRELQDTRYLQPLLVSVSLGYHRQLIERGIEPDVVSGHSLGEISALAAAGVVTPEEAIDLAAQRGECMSAAAARVDGGMIAVITPHREEVLGRLAELWPDEEVALANDNAPNQLVLAGPRNALENAAQLIARARLGTCRRLPVAGPWHGPWMQPAQRELAAWLQSVVFRTPRVTLLLNASGRQETKPDIIRQLVLRNLTEPVRWCACMERLREMKPRALFEVGPGRVLSGLARANGFGGETRIFNINNLRGVERVVQALQENR